MPAGNVPSRLNRGMPRSRAYAPTKIAAMTERAADWMRGGMSCNGDLDRNLIEAPSQTQRRDDGDGERVERTGLR